jgi:hypothetical protein
MRVGEHVKWEFLEELEAGKTVVHVRSMMHRGI